MFCSPLGKPNITENRCNQQGEVNAFIADDGAAIGDDESGYQDHHHRKSECKADESGFFL